MEENFLGLLVGEIPKANEDNPDKAVRHPLKIFVDLNLDAFEELFLADKSLFYSDNTETLVSNFYCHLDLQSAE